MPTVRNVLPRWSIGIPVASVLVLAAFWGRDLGTLLLVVLCATLVLAVLSAVYNAEVVAHRVGEPFGTLVLAVAVTVIEVGLIVSLIVFGGGDTATLARDTVFAAFMIVCNGVVGLCLVVGALKHGVVVFSFDATRGALATLAALATLTLVLPAFTTTSSGPTYSGSQLAFAGVASLVLYGVFVFVQTVRHRDYFLPVEAGADEDSHATAPSARTALVSLGMLLLALVGVVGLAKTASPSLQDAVEAIGAPQSLVGVLIALIVLAPETTAAVRTAARNRLQTSLNLALGSALASIGLTIPTLAIASIWLSEPLVLGLGGTEVVLLALTVLVSALSLGSGRATVLQGTVHLSIFAAFMFLAVVP